jgi:hypothetical protein
MMTLSHVNVVIIDDSIISAKAFIGPISQIPLIYSFFRFFFHNLQGKNILPDEAG